MSLAHTSSLQKNTNQMASRATEPLSRFPFQYTIFFQRKCKTQTRCEMTKGSGVFVLPPHITKWALRPSWSSKANISFGFAEKKKKKKLGLDFGKRKCHPVLRTYQFTNAISTAGQRDEVGWGWKEISITNLAFSHLIRVSFKDKAYRRYPQMQSSFSHTLSLTSQFPNWHSIRWTLGWNIRLQRLWCCLYDETRHSLSILTDTSVGQ